MLKEWFNGWRNGFINGWMNKPGSLHRKELQSSSVSSDTTVEV